VLGLLFGLLSGSIDSVHQYALVIDTPPHLILTIFLPVLIFESAFAMEVHTFVKTFVQVVLLAIPGLGNIAIVILRQLSKAATFPFYYKRLRKS